MCIVESKGNRNGHSYSPVIFLAHERSICTHQGSNEVIAFYFRTYAYNLHVLLLHTYEEKKYIESSIEEP